MFKFKSKKEDNNVQDKLSQKDFLLILDKIQELNNEKTPRINNWKLRQMWINNYIELCKEQITKNSELRQMS